MFLVSYFTPLDAVTAAESTLLPGHPHGDPADRFLMATARTHGVALATRDEKIIEYGKLGFRACNRVVTVQPAAHRAAQFAQIFMTRGKVRAIGGQPQITQHLTGSATAPVAAARWP